jgi:D-glycero-D-manno-heptose 1,7-bisphosphate phosphatase
LKLAAIFLDRDGTLIEDQHYPKDPEKVKLLPNAVEGLRLLREKGYLLFVVSNQSGVGRGLISDLEFKKVHEKFCAHLSDFHCRVDGFAYCFHTPEDKCFCRKPGIELIPKKFGEHSISWEDSFTVGDKICDLELADNLGGKGCLVLTGKGSETLSELQRKMGYNKYQIFSDLLAMAQTVPDRKIKVS